MNPKKKLLPRIRGSHRNPEEVNMHKERVPAQDTAYFLASPVVFW